MKPHGENGIILASWLMFGVTLAEIETGLRLGFLTVSFLGALLALWVKWRKRND